MWWVEWRIGFLRYWEKPSKKMGLLSRVNRLEKSCWWIKYSEKQTPRPRTLGRKHWDSEPANGWVFRGNRGWQSNRQGWSHLLQAPPCHCALKRWPQKLPGHNCNAPLHMATQFHQCKCRNTDKEGKPHESTVLNFTKGRIVYNEVRQQANHSLKKTMHLHNSKIR